MSHANYARHAIPNMHPIRRRKRWWRKFTSPRWLIYAAPALLLPLLIVLALDEDTGPSAIELAISALPIAGDASATTGTKAVGALGPASRQVPPSVASEIFSRSARVEAARFSLRSDAPDSGIETVDYNTAIYAALHPRSLAGEDLLSGSYALLTTPFGADLSALIFREFCVANARAGDRDTPTFKLSGELLASLASYIPLTDMNRLCPRMR